MGRGRADSSSSSSSSSEEESRRRRKRRHRDDDDDDDDDTDDASTDDDDTDSEREKRRIKKKKQKKQKKKHHKKKRKRHRHRSEDTENVLEIEPQVKAYKIKSVCLEKQAIIPPIKKSTIHEDDKDAEKMKLARDFYHNKAERYLEQHANKNKQDEGVYFSEERHTLKKSKRNYDYDTINDENNDNRYSNENKPSSSTKKEYSREYYGEHKEVQRNYSEKKEKNYISQNKEIVSKKRVVEYEQHDQAIYDGENTYAKHIERRVHMPERHVNEKRHLRYSDDDINFNKKRERNFDKKPYDEGYKGHEHYDKRKHRDYQEIVDNHRSININRPEQRGPQFHTEKKFNQMEQKEYPDDVEDHRYKQPSYKRDFVYNNYREGKQENITRKHNLHNQPSHSHHKYPNEYYQNNNNTGRQNDYQNQQRSYQERNNYRERPPKQDNRFADKYDDQQHSTRREHIHYNPNRGARIQKPRETEINTKERNQPSTFERNTIERKRKFSPQANKYDEKKSYEWGKNDKASTQDIKKEKAQKEKPNFALSGKLTEDVNTVNGIVIKYSEPPEARKPKRRWRFYPFKGEQALPILYIHRQSCFLFGRDRLVVDIPLDHPSISKQHAVLQYRSVTFTRNNNSIGKRVRPYIIDLGSANGTFINNRKIEPSKYVELLEKDVVKFGFSLREYVLLHENSKEEDMDDDDDVKTIIKTEDEKPDINKSIKSETDT